VAYTAPSTVSSRATARRLTPQRADDRYLTAAGLPEQHDEVDRHGHRRRDDEERQREEDAPELRSLVLGDVVGVLLHGRGRQPEKPGRVRVGVDEILGGIATRLGGSAVETAHPPLQAGDDVEEVAASQDVRRAPEIGHAGVVGDSDDPGLPHDGMGVGACALPAVAPPVDHLRHADDEAQLVPDADAEPPGHPVVDDDLVRADGQWVDLPLPAQRPLVEQLLLAGQAHHSNEGLALLPGDGHAVEDEPRGPRRRSRSALTGGEPRGPVLHELPGRVDDDVDLAPLGLGVSEEQRLEAVGSDERGDRGDGHDEQPRHDEHGGARAPHGTADPRAHRPRAVRPTQRRPRLFRPAWSRPGPPQRPAPRSG
jgi:hypothetical protein